MTKTISKVRTRVITIACPNCKDEIYSRAHYDFHWCSCGEVAVDGGFDCMRVLYKKKAPVYKARYINASRQELYEDWNSMSDKFGFIRGKGGL